MKLTKWDYLEKYLIKEVDAEGDTQPTKAVLKAILEKMSQLEYEEHQAIKR